MTQRKGARSIRDIPSDTLQRLQSGQEASASLVEVLAIDFSVLMSSCFPEVPASTVQQLKPSQAGITHRMQLAADIAIQTFGHEAAYQKLQHHPSDTVRGWAAYVIASSPYLSLQNKLQCIQPLADDSHFCVREWAWLAMRPDITAQLHDALRLLQTWASHPSDNIRRYAIEITRPRGVWCKHIPELKQHPDIGIKLLEAVMRDSSRYVQNSCANWLNDAGKTQPEWVLQYCQSWKTQADHPATAYIIRRALRNLRTSPK